MAAPAATFGLLFDASRVPAGWIQVGGVLFATFGLQYLITALAPSLGVADSVEKQVWSRAAAFYTASVWSRLFLAAAFAGLVAARRAELALLLLAGLNLLGAAAMQRALTRRGARPAAAAGPAGGAGPAEEGFVVGGDGVLLLDEREEAGGGGRPASPAEYYMSKLA